MRLTVETLQRLKGWEVIHLMERLYGISEQAAELALMGVEDRVDGRRVWGTATASVPKTTLAELAANGNDRGWDKDALLSDFCAHGELDPGDYEILYEEG